jgi:hypothetical protein
MLKKYLRLTIIGITQAILPITVLALLVPYFLEHTENLHKLRGFLSDWNLVFLVIHALFYCLIFFLWPAVVRHLARRRQIEMSASELTQAIGARCYLLSAFILLELLMLWR